MDEQLKQLLEYTRFHIGMYATLSTLLITVLTSDKVRLVNRRYSYWLAGTLLCFLLAGAAGGLVGSNAPDFGTYADFMSASIGPWNSELLSTRLCVHLEHTFFWIGIMLAGVGILATHSVGAAGHRPEVAVVAATGAP